ncbi:geranylgeranylglyceryl/heptaprenylglyceryl phosphate synthase [Candidatus Bathyarchaeota archaeon]|nr:geranylgeranylglyceryl/heptaprenylglyceryl phosphate synthase [Candidatus Bathyarchaeota archaeon]
MRGKVERYLLDKISSEGCIHITLVDPDKSSSMNCSTIAKMAEEGGTSAIMVGGSTLYAKEDLDEAVLSIKENVKVPIILFPNGPVGISKHADAIWFMSLLNSSNTYWIVDAQALSAPLVKRYQLEALPMGYIIAGEGCVAGHVGQARLINYKHPELAVGYGMAAEQLGMRFVYLEAGSGAESPIPVSMINAVKKHIGVPLIVGGGLRDPKSALNAKQAGADIVVTGTLVEEEREVKDKISEIVSALNEKR